MDYLVKIFLILFLFVGCSKDESCFCTETTTDIRYGEVYVDEYWIDNCYEPFHQVNFYEWGNIVIDCR